jgi:hypothetical protein
MTKIPINKTKNPMIFASKNTKIAQKKNTKFLLKFSKIAPKLYSKNFNVVSFALLSRYRSVTVTVIDRRQPIPNRYHSVTLPLPSVSDRYLPLPTVTHRYSPLPTVTITNRYSPLQVTVGNGE